MTFPFEYLQANHKGITGILWFKLLGTRFSFLICETLKAFPDLFLILFSWTLKVKNKFLAVSNAKLKLGSRLPAL